MATKQNIDYLNEQTLTNKITLAKGVVATITTTLDLDNGTYNGYQRHDVYLNGKELWVFDDPSDSLDDIISNVFELMEYDIMEETLDELCN